MISNLRPGLQSDLPFFLIYKFVLTHYGLVTLYGTIDLGQHWLRLWLGAVRHRAITWTSVRLSMGYVAFTCEQFPRRYSEYHSVRPPHLLGANEVLLEWIKVYRDHFVYAPSQQETTLQCNVVSHWPDTFTKWSQSIFEDYWFFQTKFECSLLFSDLGRRRWSWRMCHCWLLVVPSSCTSTNMWVRASRATSAPATRTCHLANRSNGTPGEEAHC